MEHRPYLSAVQQRELAELGVSVREFPPVPLMVGAYENLENESNLLPEVRCGLSAIQVRSIWQHGISSGKGATVRDTSLILFAYCFNGLRESLVVSVSASDAEMKY